MTPSLPRWSGKLLLIVLSTTILMSPNQLQLLLNALQILISGSLVKPAWSPLFVACWLKARAFPATAFPSWGTGKPVSKIGRASCRERVDISEDRTAVKRKV